MPPWARQSNICELQVETKHIRPNIIVASSTGRWSSSMGSRNFIIAVETPLLSLYLFCRLNTVRYCTSTVPVREGLVAGTNLMARCQIRKYWQFSALHDVQFSGCGTESPEGTYWVRGYAARELRFYMQTIPAKREVGILTTTGPLHVMCSFSFTHTELFFSSLRKVVF